MEIPEKSLNGNDQVPGSKLESKHILRRHICEWAILLAFGIAFASALGGVSFAQSSRGFLLFGDVKVDSSQVAPDKPMILDIVLCKKDMQVVNRQRLSDNGRYRFADVPAGDYWLVLELEGAELFRDSVFIANSSMSVDVKHDLSVALRPAGGRGAGVVNAADLYNRSGPNKSLYGKSAQKIESKNYGDAIATLLQVVAADPKDFPAWSDLGMLYFIRKEYEAAENSYASALTAKPDYFPALLNKGRVQLARKNYEPAIASLEAALNLDPKSASVSFFLGEAYLQIKKGSKAVGYLNQALTLDPVGMAEAHLRLAALYNGAGLKDKAATEYEQFLKTKPDYPDRKKLEEYISANKKQ